MGGMDTPSITSSVSVHLNSLKQMTLDRHNFCIFLQSKNYPQNDGVSAWRTYFVANEWVKLSTARKCSMFIQMVSVSAIILVSCPAIASSFESDSNRFRVRFFFSQTKLLALRHVDAVDTQNVSPEPVQALAVGLIVYLVCYAVQRLFHLTIQQWYIKNTMQQFIDICSMSNISVFIFCLKSFGFYIHGRYEPNCMARIFHSFIHLLTSLCN